MGCKKKCCKKKCCKKKCCDTCWDCCDPCRPRCCFPPCPVVPPVPTTFIVSNLYVVPLTGVYEAIVTTNSTATVVPNGIYNIFDGVANVSVYVVRLNIAVTGLGNLYYIQVVGPTQTFRSVATYTLTPLALGLTLPTVVPEVVATGGTVTGTTTNLVFITGITTTGTLTDSRANQVNVGLISYPANETVTVNTVGVGQTFLSYSTGATPATTTTIREYVSSGKILLA